jgi:hypothetical protein
MLRVMGRVLAMQGLPGTSVAEAEALWYDPGRRASFVDGFARAAKVEGGWPAAGGRLVWDARPGAPRERVVEVVARYEQRVGQTAEVEDARIRGTQTVTFTPASDGCRITIELAYELKEPGPIGPLRDLLLVRRPLADALRRTLVRFARELAAERELTRTLS